MRKVVAASSASVYGMAERFPTPEDHHPYNNDTIYGAAKAFNEGMLRSYHAMYGLDYVALRYFNVYGPRMDVHGVYTEVLVRWMERIAPGRPPLILGDGRQTMDFVHVADVARANLLAATADVTDDVFNVASGTETSLAELARTLLAVMGAGPVRRARPGARGQQRGSPARRHRPRARAARLPRRGHARGRAARVSSTWWRARARGGRGSQRSWTSPIPIMRPWLGAEEAAAVADACRSGWVAQGPKVAAFEAAFAAPSAPATPSRRPRAPPRCTWRCIALGVGPGRRGRRPLVVVHRHRQRAALRRRPPVFADVDLATQNLTPATRRARRSPRRRAP